MQNPLHIAIFASGTGTTLQTLIDQQTQRGYHITLVITNRECQAIERAQKHHIPVLQSKDWTTIDSTLVKNDIDLIVLAGFLAILPQWFCEKWNKQIINIHPSLLPKFGGKGMYGIHVHEAVLAAKEQITGCTVHYVSAEVDGGSIIAQTQVEVCSDDTPQSLSQRVQEEEKILLTHILSSWKNNS